MLHSMINKRVIRYLFNICIVLCLAVSTACAQDCVNVFVEAEELYNNGLFDDSINTLDSCLEIEELSDKERGRFYRLKGLNYIAKGLQEKARGAVRDLLIVVPEYKADLNQDHPMLIQLLEEIRQSQAVGQEEPPVAKKKKRTWLWVGLGVAVVASAAVIPPPPPPTGGIDLPPAFPSN